MSELHTGGAERERSERTTYGLLVLRLGDEVSRDRRSTDDEHGADEPRNEARVPVFVELRGDRAFAALRHLDVVAPRVIALLLHDDLMAAGVDRAFPARRADGLAVDLDRRAFGARDDEQLALPLIAREDHGDGLV